MSKHSGLRRTRWMLGALLPLAMLAAACDETDGTSTDAGEQTGGSEDISASTSPPPEGEPVKLMMIAPITSGDTNPSSREAALAAAEAINDSGGIQGRPVDMIVCDDEYSANAASNCARRAVDEGVVAIVAAQTVHGDAYVPIAEAAGIPIVGNLQASQTDLLSDFVFPITATLSYSIGAAAVAAAAGAESYHLAVFDGGDGLEFLRETGEQIAADIGIESAGDTRIPLTAGDMAPYAAAVTSSGTEAVGTALTSEALISFVNALLDEGVSLDEMVVLGTSDAIWQEVVDSFDGAADGLYVVSSTFPTDYMENDNVRRFNEEMDAVGAEAERNSLAFQTWASVHITADFLQDTPVIDRPSLLNALRTAGPMEYDGFAPWDWTQPVYSEGPYSDTALPLLSVYSDRFLVSQVIDGTLTPVVDDYVRVGEQIDLNTD